MLSLTSSSDRPEPVLDAAKLASAVSGVVLSVGAVLVLVGWATTDQVKSWSVIAGGAVTAIGTLLAVVLPVITALGARAQVTPLAAPVGVDGVPLITGATTAAAPADAPFTPAAAGDDTGELSPAATESAAPATAASDPSTAAVDDYEKWVSQLDTDEPVGSAPATPVDRTPQPIELLAQAAVTSPSTPANSGDADTAVMPTDGQPPVPTGSTAIATAVQTA